MLRGIADVGNVGPFEVAEPGLEGCDHAARVVDAERRLGDVGDGRIVRQVEPGDVLDRRDEVNGRADLPRGAFDLGMAGMADQDQRPAARHVALALVMDLRHQRTGGIQHGQAARLRLVDDRLGHAMGTEDRDRAVRDLVQLVDEHGAHALEPLDDMAIVHDLVAHIDRGAELLERPLDDLDCADHAGTEAPRLGQDNPHSRSTPRSGSDGDTRRIATTATQPASGRRGFIVQSAVSSIEHVCRRD